MSNLHPECLYWRDIIITVTKLLLLLLLYVFVVVADEQDEQKLIEEINKVRFVLIVPMKYSW